MSSISGIELLDQNVRVQLMLNYVDVDMIDPSHHGIALRDMIKICKLGMIDNRGDFKDTCLVSFNFVSYTKTKKEFQFILE